MNLVEDKIVHLLTGKHNLYEVSVDELQAISDEQPFFSVAQLLLTQKMKQVNHPGFVQQLQKTALFFPNIFWLDKHLQEVSPAETAAVAPVVFSTPTPSFPAAESSMAVAEEKVTPLPVAVIPEPEAPAAAPSFYNTSPEAEEEEDLNPITAQYRHTPVTEEALPATPEPAVTEIPEAPAPETFVTAAVDEPVTEQQTAATVAADWEEPLAHILPQAAAVEEESPIAAAWHYTPPVIEEVGAATPESVEVIATPVEQPYVAPEPEAAATPPVQDAVIEQEAPPSIVADTQEQSAAFEHSIKESFAASISETPAIDEDELPVDSIGETGEVADMPNLRLAEMMQQQAASFNKPVEEDATLSIESEPYHTVDYFASQGIKAVESSEDGLSKKVRKFTDWLKHMKKVTPHPADLGTDAELEQVVHGIAATSIESKEIVTEAMAEVLVKQGKIDKAVLLYSKLSFLNPDKTAYFAAKILELKGN